MIVFKAECGHSVRAKDGDAGGIVRCSYCGRNAKVPETPDSNLNFLLEEIEQTGVSVKESRRRRPFFGKRRAVRDLRKDRSIDPFDIILRLCYFAVLIVIMVVVVRKWVMPMFDAEERARRMGGADGSLATSSMEAAKKPSRPLRDAMGLTTESGLSGLYVSSTPTGAEAFVIEDSKAPAFGRINRVSGVGTQRTNGFFRHLTDGSYTVEIAFPWNDPSLSDPSLSNYQDFLAFRRSIERASDAQRKQLVEDYFVPDEATEAFIAETDERIFFVRTYRGVTLREGRSKGVRALFLPRLGKREGRAFSIEPLMYGYIPDVRAYAFDESHARNELDYYGVPEAEQRFVIEGLQRIGVIPYPTSDGRMRMFKIDIHDGAFTARVLREALP